MNKQQDSIQANNNAGREHDEIDLMDLFTILWNGKLLVVTCALLAFIIGFSYVATVPSIYKVQSKLTKPHAMDLAFTQLELLKLEPGDGAAIQSFKALYSPDEVFEQVVQALASRSSQKEFLLLFIREGSDERVDSQWFFNSLNVSRERQDKNYTGVFSVSMLCEDRELCIELIDGYIEFIRIQGRQGLVEEMLALLDSDYHKTEQKSDYLKNVHRQAMSDQIEALNSQIAVARGLQWADPNINVMSSDKRVSRYYEGYRLLELERESLKNRLNNDAFVNGLREQQRKLERIELERKWIKSYGDEISVANVVDYAYYSQRPVAPRKQIILAFSVILGGMIGVFAVFIRQGVRSYWARAVGRRR